MTTGLIKAKN